MITFLFWTAILIGIPVIGLLFLGFVIWMEERWPYDA